jgi:hypothetical protein
MSSYSGDVDSDGLPHGVGEASYYSTPTCSARVYMGEFRYGMKMGIGCVIYPKEKPFIGQWHRDEITGYGYKGLKNGHEYHGQWVKDAMSGLGEYRYSIDSRYLGEFLDNRQHGRGLDLIARDNSAVDYHQGLVILRDKGIFIINVFDSS